MEDKNGLWKSGDIELTREKLVLIQKNYNLIVIAGPGAGKTEFLAQKARFLFDVGLCKRPFGILALSFKRDAALNIKERVICRCKIEDIDRFDSFTFDAFVKGIFDRFLSLIPNDRKPNKTYQLVFNKKHEKKPIQIDLKTTVYNEVFLLLKNKPEIIDFLRARYKYVLLDEFQDTNQNQYNIIKTIFKGSNSIIIAVGDDKQKIMTYAGALNRIFNQYQKDFNAERKYLFENHRSKDEIQRVLSYFANFLDPEIKIHNDNKKGGDSGLFNYLIFKNDENEGEFVAKKIIELLNEGFAPRDICILRRNRNVDCSILIQNLLKHNIYVRYEDQFQDNLSEPTIVFTILFLKMCFDNPDVEGWLRIVNLFEHFRGFNDLTPLYKIRNLRRELNTKIQKFKDILIRTKTLLDLKIIVYKFLDFLGIKKLKQFYPQYQQDKYLHEVITKFIEFYFHYFKKNNDWKQALLNLIGENSIPIITVHKSKSLEFEVVFMIGIESKFYWEKGTLEENREEIRVFFVGISRTKSLCYISSCFERKGINSTFNSTPIKNIITLFKNAKIPFSKYPN